MKCYESFFIFQSHSEGIGVNGTNLSLYFGSKRTENMKKNLAPDVDLVSLHDSVVSEKVGFINLFSIHQNFFNNRIAHVFNEEPTNMIHVLEFCNSFHRAGPILLFNAFTYRIAKLGKGR